VTRAFVNKDRASAALRRAQPLVELLIQNRELGDGTGVTVVIVSDGGDILAQATFGTLDGKHAYAPIALSKAIMVSREQRSSGEVVVQPHLLEKGDTTYEGGAYFDSFSVGAGGLEDHYDLLVSRIIGALSS
jgi:hypothetical protein